MTNTKSQQVGKHPSSSARAQTMLDSRRAESTRCRQRVIAALDRTATEGMKQWPGASPYRPQRGRAAALAKAGGQSRPRRGPRMSIPPHHPTR